jgi:hypothetical protein
MREGDIEGSDEGKLKGLEEGKLKARVLQRRKTIILWSPLAYFLPGPPAFLHLSCLLNLLLMMHLPCKSWNE